ncbi:MAG: hypothetical protein FVQ77_11095 [Cytophagales bacterium]|nr:hypothetical protein [Cytophagales bacterium]
MFNKIILTFGTKFFIAALNFVIIILTTQFLGAEGRGIISLFILNITIILMFNNFVGGGALVYLIPRTNFFQLLIPSYVWAIIIAIILTTGLSLTNLTHTEYTIDLLLLSLIYSFTSINSTILLGNQKIKQYNLITFVQIILLLLSFLVLLFLLNKKEVFSYIISLYVSFSFSLAISLFFVLQDIKPILKDNFGIVIKKIFSYGFFAELGNILQLFNYRLSYYLLDFFYGTFYLGIYSTGVSLAEVFWLMSKSISLVQYARIANSKDKEYSISLTIKLAKLSFITTMLILIPVLLLSSKTYTLIFGDEFEEVRNVLLYLSVGIISFSVSRIFSHYFSGIGKFYINTISAAIGFAFTIIFGFILIPKYHYTGAAITASLSYIFTTIFQFVIFVRITNSKLNEFMPSLNDFRLFIKEFKKALV